MQQFDSLLKMFGRMTIYGVVLGAIAGFLVGMTVLTAFPGTSAREVLESIVGLIMLSLLYGGFFGGMYGGTSGLFCGLVMALVTAVAFRDIRNLQRFKIVMGIITTVITSGVFVLGGLWEFSSGIELTWASAMILSVVIAAYASQIVSRKYYYEMSFRKQKIEPQYDFA